MMVLLLFLVLLFLLIVNLSHPDHDLMNPATILCFIFLIYSLSCLIFQSEYKITLIPETVLVIVFGVASFCIVSLFTSRKSSNIIVKASKENKTHNYNYIHINKRLVYLLLFCQLLTIIFFIQYLNSISIAYDGQVRSLSEVINLYDTMTKFWTETFNRLNVPIPMVYRVLNPIVTAGAWLILYILVNNFVINKKVPLEQIAVVILMCVLILLNGSRSPLFRVMTAIFCLYYVLSVRAGKIKKIGYQSVIKGAFFAIGIILFFIVVLKMMGRTGTELSVSRYFFIYVGAPLVNLNTFLENGKHLGFSMPFGAQTFKALYGYIGKLFSISAFHYPGIGSFSFSKNGIEIGNVYTMFYKYIYDFGYWGVILLTLIMAFYYVFSYNAIMREKSKMKIDFKLLIYAYLFNDLIMSAFSSRFYEIILDAPFLKLLILSWLIDKFIIEHGFYLGKTLIRIPDIHFFTNLSSKRCFARCKSKFKIQIKEAENFEIRGNKIKKTERSQKLHI
jgi:oligosaccharide repeat unit polymerase